MKVSLSKFARIGLLSSILLTVSCNNLKTAEGSKPLPMANLENGFQKVPDSIQTSVYWYWMSDNISKEGVIKDLESMKKVGINRAFIGNIGLNEVPYGKVKILSKEWIDIVHTALKKATELNIEIGIFNSPGWSQSGGPWITPEESMRYLTSSEVVLKGPKTIELALEKPAEVFQDVRVIAFPKPKDYGTNINQLKPKYNDNAKALFDGNLETDVKIPVKDDFSIVLSTSKAFTARSLTIYPGHKAMKFKIEILAFSNGQYKSLKTTTVDRSNDALNTGFSPYAPAVISIPSTTSDKFKLVIHEATANTSLQEVVLSSSPKIENYAEKTLAKMFPTPLPYWNEYQWDPQPIVDDKATIVDPSKIVDVSKFMTANGTLKWQVPEGDWIIMRSGMTPTKVTNSPASKEGTGLEVDKMSKKHVATHFKAFLGMIMDSIPAADRKTWKITVEDSYETGGQNWTDGLIDKFKSSFGYSPLPYIPVLSGTVVGSQEMSDRFLWDLRRFIANEVAYEYVAGLREVSHEHGLTTWLENYGHWGFPGEFLMYGGQSDEIGGEFWSEGELGNIENRAASSAAHIYGKTKVSAESFTAGGKTFARYPEMMKQRGDRFFTEGINNTLLHLFIEQPYEDKLPGINAPFGNEFNRNNTWFYDMDMFLQYIKRCNLMLQQGTYVADVAYFIGEDAPKMTGVRDPELPDGYSFDYINAEVIETRITVKDGRLTLPDGLSYKILVLPKLETMRPALLKKIAALVKQGAVILGPQPNRSPSLQGYPKADQEIKNMASELWGDVNGSSVKSRDYGKGKVLSGMDMQQALDFIKTIADYKVKQDSTLFIHRRMAEGEIYFVSNQGSKSIKIAPEFRVTGKSPELWQAVTGTVRDLPEYTVNDQTTTVPLELAPLESAFVIFRKSVDTKGQSHPTVVNFPKVATATEITGAWSVQFETAMRGPKEPVIFDKLTDWTLRPETNLKYYSGKAIYKKDFEIGKVKGNQKVFLDLGKIMVVGKVKVNGVEVGGVWTYPYHVDITRALKQGKNTLEISVTNNWMNRIIGDMNLPESERDTWLTFNPYNKNSPLQSSGLMGPVKLETVNY